jgi:hypothetical protein
MLQGVEGGWRETGMLGIRLGRSGTAAAVQLLLMCLRTLKCHGCPTSKSVVWRIFD